MKIFYKSGPSTESCQIPQLISDQLLYDDLKCHLEVPEQPPKVFYEKVAFRNSVKFTGKQLCQSLFFNKLAKVCNFIKKETLTEAFSCEFCEISKDTFFTEHL